MPRYKLRALLIVLALGPPLLAVALTVAAQYLGRPEPEVMDFEVGYTTEIVIKCKFPDCNED